MLHAAIKIKVRRRGIHGGQSTKLMKGVRLKILTEWKKQCDQKRSGWSKDTLPEEKLQHVIVYPADGSLPHPDTCRKWVVKYVNRNNFDHITPHDFRHFYTTYLLTKGVDIKTVAKMAGHQDETTTLKIYTAITKEGYDKAVAVLNAV